MAQQDLHCQQCGRSWRARFPVEGKALHCIACGGALGTAPAAGVGRPPKDRWQGGKVAGVKLTRLLAVRPDHHVYRGEHRRMRVDIRVEFYPESLVGADRQHVEDLFRRAALTAEIKSPYVNTLMEIGRVREGYYIFSEFKPSDLRRALAKEGRLEPGRTLEIIEGALRGLEAVEATGAAHGNACVDGILLGYDGSPALDHLGTLRRRSDVNRLVLSEGGTVAGPALYLAPERADDPRDRDLLSDLYSLGATMYHALSGRPPFEGVTGARVVAMRAEQPVPRLEAACPDLPESLCEFVARLMAEDPDARPPGPAAAREELQDCAVTLSRSRRIAPVRAAVTPRERVRGALKWTGLWTVAAVVLVALAIMPMTMMLRRRAERKEQAEGRPPRPDAPRTALVVLQPGGPAGGGALPAERRLAVEALLSLAVAAHPGIGLQHPSGADAHRQEGADPVGLAQRLGAEFVLLAVHSPGHERRKWTLAFLSPTGQWAVRAKCIVSDEAEDGLAALEDAVQDVLGKASARLKLPAEDSAPPATGASAEAWAHAGRALRAEREGRLDAAEEEAGKAVELAPDAAPFAVLLALCRCIRQAEETGRFPPADTPPPERLQPELAELAGVLDAMGRNDPDDVRERFGGYLVRFPRSARGYYLLGLWRLLGERRPEDATHDFAHAAALDPGYMPAVRRGQGSEPDAGPDGPTQ